MIILGVSRHFYRSKNLKSDYHGQNICRLFHALPQHLFTANKLELYYYDKFRNWPTKSQFLIIVPKNYKKYAVKSSKETSILLDFFHYCTLNSLFNNCIRL